MVDVVVTTHNRQAMLRQTLESLYAMHEQTKFRLWVSDDASTDGTIEYLAETVRPRASGVLLNGKRQGVVYNFDQLWNAVDLADAFLDEKPWLSYLQDDMRSCELEWLELLAEAFEELAEEHGVGFVTGYDAPEHPVERETQWRGRRVFLKRSSTASHLMAPKTFWRSIGYVPSHNPDGSERGFPNRRRGSHIDLYLTGCRSGSRFVSGASAPDSSWKQGKRVLVIPGVLEHMAHSASESTWRR